MKKGKRKHPISLATNKIKLKMKQRLKCKAFMQTMKLLQDNSRDMPQDVIVENIFILNIRPQKSQ